MLRRFLKALLFVWKRFADARLLDWLHPGVWRFVGSAVTGIAGSLIGWLKGIPVYLWLPLGVLVAIAALLVCHLVLWLKDRSSRPAVSPFKVIFDPTNPGRHFYALENAPLAPGATEPVVYWEYRVEVTNASSADVRNVQVTAASLGVVGSRPVAMPFDRTKKDVADFTPGQSMLVPILRWSHPAVPPGMVVGAYGPIEVVVTADGVLPLKRRFEFDHRRTPMIHD